MKKSNKNILSAFYCLNIAEFIFSCFLPQNDIKERLDVFLKHSEHCIFYCYISESILLFSPINKYTGHFLFL